MSGNERKQWSEREEIKETNYEIEKERRKRERIKRERRSPWLRQHQVVGSD